MGRMSLRGTLPCYKDTKVRGADSCESLPTTHLASGLIEAQLMPELILTHGARRVDLVAEDKEGNL